MSRDIEDKIIEVVTEMEVVDVSNNDYSHHEMAVALHGKSLLAFKGTFEWAISCLKKGHRVARSGWNGKGMYLAIQKGSTIPAEHARGGVAKCVADDGADEVVINDHIDMKTADGSVCVGWLASQSDMLAEDWIVLDIV